MIKLNPLQQVVLRIEEEYEFVTDNVAVLSLEQFEYHMRQIHLLCSKYNNNV